MYYVEEERAVASLFCRVNVLLNFMEVSLIVKKGYGSGSILKILPDPDSTLFYVGF